MKLSIIVPVYNEEKSISANLNKIIAFLEKTKRKYEMVVVDDGSDDDTLEEVKKIKNSKIRLISYRPNRGKGFAVKTGMLTSTGDWILMCDADLSTPIEELEKLLKYAKEYDIVIGSRALKESKVKSKLHRVLLGRVGNMLIRMFAVRGIKDTQCGFKLFNRKALKVFKIQTIKGWGFDFEVLFIAQKHGFKIKEVPVVWNSGETTRVGVSSYLKTMIELFKVRINNLMGLYG